jgi:membrane-associated phospholipid phosphatase
VFLAYLAIDTAILMLNAGRIPLAPLFFAVNAASAGLVMLLTRLEEPLSPLLRFLGSTYALFLTLAYYTKTGLVNQEIARLHDLTIQGWDRAVFGSDISLTWHHRMPSAALSTFLHASYAAFYPMVLLPCVLLFLPAYRARFERGMLQLTATLYLCYATFALWPVAGPRYFFGVAAGRAADVPAARFVHAVLEGGSAWGTAFPSSHVAAAWCALIILLPTHRRLALLLAPVAGGLALGTVYGQFHYGIDALAGAAGALLVWALAGYRK